MDRIPPILRFLLIQALALASTAGLAQLETVSAHVSGWGWVALDAAIAALLAVLVRLPWWWLPAAIALPMAVAATAESAIPWWAWATALGALVLVYGGGIVTRVPLYLSNEPAVDALARLLPSTPGVTACDLGAGLGGPTIGLAHRRPDALITGVESSPLPWLICRIRAVRQRNAHMRFGNIFTEDLAAYDLVYVFLSPEPMPRLWAKARAEMRPGSLLVSNTFAVPDMVPGETIVLPGRADAKLFIYRM